MIYPRVRERARHLSDGQLAALLRKAEKGSEEYRGLLDEKIVRKNRLPEPGRPEAERVKAELLKVMRELSRWRRRIGVIEGASLYCWYLDEKRHQLLRELHRRKK